MQSSLIGKIEKARLYAQEPGRFAMTALACAVRGDNSTHHVTLQNETWRCDCHFFADFATCSHTMAVQRLLRGMVPEEMPEHPAVASA